MRKVHMKLHPGLEWRIFDILTNVDIDIHCCLWKKYSCPYNKKKITQWLKDINFIFSW